MILLSMIFSLAMTVAFAEESSSAPDFFETFANPRVSECHDHFDILPYLQAAIIDTDGPENDPGQPTENALPPEVSENIKSFLKTGRLNLPADKANDPVAQRCATFAEGMLIGGVGRSLMDAFVRSAGKAAEAIGEALSRAFGHASPKK